jgi:hypothetical protein
MTLAEERRLMRFASTGMAPGMTVCLHLVMEHAARPWAEQVLPYGLASMMLVISSGLDPDRDLARRALAGPSRRAIARLIASPPSCSALPYACISAVDDLEP